MADNILLKQIKGGDLTVTDDGTYLVIAYGSTTLFKIRKADNQLMLDAGVDTDAF